MKSSVSDLPGTPGSQTAPASVRVSEPKDSLPASEELDETELARVVERITSEVRAGRQPRLEDYQAQHPSLATVLAQVFPTLLLVEEVGAPECDSSFTQVPSGEAKRGEMGTTSTPMLGEYRLLRELGRGGMGVVYEAEHGRLGRRVALKRLSSILRDQPEQRERFLREARSIARLEHAHIVGVFDVGEIDTTSFYTMQLIEGLSLDRVIESLRSSRSPSESCAVEDRLFDSFLLVTDSDASSGKRPRYFARVAQLVADVAGALAYAHENGVVHRDIKPSNLLLDEAGKIWITDFGLAKLEGSESLTQPGDLIGTLRYMSPERFDGWADPRSDIYSLGATLYELLTLRPVHTERDRTKLLRDVERCDITPPRRIEPGVPLDLETIVLKTLDRDPRQRYASARTLESDLRAFVAGRPIEARRHSRTERLRLWCRRNPLLTSLSALVALLLLVVAIGSTYAVFQLQDSHEETTRHLYRSLIDQARSGRADQRAGSRERSLFALRQAAEIEASDAVRNETIAQLMRADLRELRRWPRIGGPVAFDGQLLRHARGLEDRVEVSDSATGRVLDSIAEPFRVSELLFSPDDRLLFWRTDESIVMYDLVQRMPVRKILGHFQEDTAVFSPDSSWLFVRPLRGHYQRVSTSMDVSEESVRLPQSFIDISFSPGGEWVAGVYMHQIKIYRTEDLLHSTDSVTTLEYEEGSIYLEPCVSGIAWLDDGTTLAAAGRDETIQFWNLETAQRGSELEGHHEFVETLLATPDGRYLVSYGFDGTSRLWDASSRTQVCTFAGQILASDRSGQRFAFATSSELGILELVRPQASFSVRVRSPGSPHAQGVFHPDGIWIVTSCLDGLEIWNGRTGERFGHLVGWYVNSISFSPAGDWMLTGSLEGLVRWPIRKFETAGEARYEIGEGTSIYNASPIHRFVSSADGRTVLFTEEQQLKWLDPMQPEEIRQYRAEVNFWGDWGLAVSSDGSKLLACGWDRRGHLVLDGETGREHCRIPYLDEAGGNVFFVPGTGEMVLAHESGYLTYDSQGQRLPDLDTIDSPKSGYIAFPNAASLRATLVTPRQIRVATADGSRELCRLEGRGEGAYQCLAWSPDGRRLLAITGGENFMDVWDFAKFSRLLREAGLAWGFDWRESETEALESLDVSLPEGFPEN